MHRLKLLPLRPASYHPKNDPKAIHSPAGECPLFVQNVKDQHPGKPIELWLQDEMRFGQQGTKTTVWGVTGSRAQTVRQTAYEWCYVFGAVNPMTGNSSALVAPSVNTELMSQHLQFISQGGGGKDARPF